MRRLGTRRPRMSRMLGCSLGRRWHSGVTTSRSVFGSGRPCAGRRALSRHPVRSFTSRFWFCRNRSVPVGMSGLAGAACCRVLMRRMDCGRTYRSRPGRLGRNGAVAFQFAGFGSGGNRRLTVIG